MDKPILILQMQRMGDLILSFPLFLWLRNAWPDSPIWVVAEKKFYEGLVGLSPRVLYVPWQKYDAVLDRKFSLVINLSHRKEAAWLAGKVAADKIVGPYSRDGALRIHGKWQLYRSSIVHNNRYNRFHWAELNALDVVSHDLMKKTVWPPLVSDRDNRRIGIFIGASQEIKRPRPGFFALLCKELIRRNYKPVILGGPAEKKTAGQILALCKVKPLSMAGKLSLPQLAAMFKSFGLLITPDTGPMHLAAWSGLPLLNLSLGPVNPWETGPYQPGHGIVRSNVSCTGCWECIQPDPLCMDTFKVRQIVLLMEKMLAGQLKDLAEEDLAGLNVYASGRKRGLYNLMPCKAKIMVGRHLAGFWQSYWMFNFGLSNEDSVRQQAAAMQEKYPFVTEKLKASSAIFLKQMKSIIQKGMVPDSGFWRTCPPYFRPFVGYNHLMWQNLDYSAGSMKVSIKMVQGLLDILPGR